MIIGMLVQIVVQITSLSLNSLELGDYRFPTLLGQCEGFSKGIVAEPEKGKVSQDRKARAPAGFSRSSLSCRSILGSC